MIQKFCDSLFGFSLSFTRFWAKLENGTSFLISSNLFQFWAKSLKLVDNATFQVQRT